MTICSRSSIQDVNYRGSGSGKANVLLHLIKAQGSNNLIPKIYQYAKDLNEPLYQFLIKKT